MSSLSAFRALAIASALIATNGLAHAQCFEPNFGTFVGTGDDSVLAIQPIGFAFPFGGTTYTDVHISTNGFLYLSNAGVPAPGSSGCCSGSSATLASGQPRIAPWWHDCIVSAPGGVYINQLAGRTVITFDRIKEYNVAPELVIQVQLLASGEVTFYYDSNVLVRTSGTCLAGLSPGGTTAPAASDLSVGSVGGADTTVFELFTTTAAFDLAAKLVSFRPNANNGYDVTTIGCVSAFSVEYGAGCPSGCATYELFTAGIDLNGAARHFFPNGSGGYIVNDCAGCFNTDIGADLLLGDDALALVSLGFNFPFCGTDKTDIDVCSNGYVWLNGGVNALADFSESVTELLDQDDRIAVVWDDFNPGAGGSVHFNALPGVALVTWNAVPQFNTADSNTFQLQLFPNGSFIINCASLATTDALIGYAGNAPGRGYAADLSLPSFDTGAVGVPFAHNAQPGFRPVLGQVFRVFFDDFPAGAVHVAWMFGFTRADIDLGPIGAPGCRLLHTADFLWIGGPWAAGPLSGNVSIPNDPALAGLRVDSQGVALVPGINPLGVATSNGLELVLGSF